MMTRQAMGVRSVPRPYSVSLKGFGTRRLKEGSEAREGRKRFETAVEFRVTFKAADQGQGTMTVWIDTVQEEKKK